MAKIQILLVVGTITSDLMVLFTALDGACYAAVQCWHISPQEYQSFQLLIVSRGWWGWHDYLLAWQAGEWLSCLVMAVPSGDTRQEGLRHKLPCCFSLFCFYRHHQL